MNYGRAIRLARVARGMSQKDLAADAGVTNTYLSLIEKEHRTPSLDKLEAIARALDVPFPVLTFVAAEEDDLKGIDPATADRLGKLMIDLVISSADGNAS